MENLLHNDVLEKKSFFDVAIIGGGLAGLSLSILLSRSGYKVILFEKEKYPFHKVCGEYVSMESWNFIKDLGLNLSALNLPIINKLLVSAPGGNFIESKLDLGGFGISRFFLDHELKKIASQNGVKVCEETKVNEVFFSDEMFTVKYHGGEITSSVAAGSFGKRSNLDVKWQRDFARQKPGKLNNYIGVKYHINTSFPGDTIALHNFMNGYCGISKVENDTCCLCYLTTAKDLKDHHNSIPEMEKHVLYKNPFLKKIFTESEFFFAEPVTISQISFAKKSQVENHVLLLGDAAGMIGPLCGNGMSMAFHSAKIAFKNIDPYLRKVFQREEMEKQYVRQWQQQFGARLRNGRILQQLFGKEKVTDWFIGVVKYFPFVVNKIIKATHGREF